MKWPMVTLDTVLASLEAGSRPRGGTKDVKDGVPSLGGEHLNNNGGFNFTSLKYIPEEHFAIMRKGIVRLHDILVVKDGATTGKTSFVRDDFPFEHAAVNEHVFIVRVCSEIFHPAFVFYFLFSKRGQAEIHKDFRGATIGGISRQFPKKVNIPLPPPSEQRRIVEILDQADALRKKRAEADAKAARILPALFYKMFGDPATNPKGWKVVKLGDVVLETQYGTSVRSNTLGQGLPVLRMNNINFNGYLDLTDLKYVDLPKREREKYLLTKGDILFNRTNSKELVGKTGLWRGEMEAVPASYLIRVRVDRNFVLPEFIWAYMNCPFVKQLLLNKARRAIGMANINARELRSLPLILPDRGSQEAFAEHIAALELLRSQRNRTALVIDQLFETLLHRAFTGDLTAKWRKAHMKELLEEMEQQAKALETPISEDRPATIRIKHNKRRAKG